MSAARCHRSTKAQRIADLLGKGLLAFTQSESPEFEISGLAAVRLCPMRFHSFAKGKLGDTGLIEFPEAGGHHAFVLLLGGFRERHD